MSLAGVLEKVDDHLNPIVVKELRQAVRGRFVTAVLLIFLFVQLVFLGTYLLLGGVGVGTGDLEAQHGRTVFTVLQGILLFTCMLFLPLYTGARLGAERSDTNQDLLFITTLRPRAIISGKLWSAVVVAVVIFSACAPFMTFTYLLRGLDLFSIVLVLAIDFVAVVATIQLAIFLGAIPGNRIVKIMLGVVGFVVLALAFYGTLALTITLLSVAAITRLAEERQFWATLSMVGAALLMTIGLLFTWAVALVSPPSSNRALPSRLALILGWAGTAVVFGLWDIPLAPATYGAFMAAWLTLVGAYCCVQILIAINERQGWGSRVARRIPRNWLLRVPAFFLYSGAAGGVLLAVVLFVLSWPVMQLFRQAVPSSYPAMPGRSYDAPTIMFEIAAVFFLEIYSYGLAAVLLRRMTRRLRQEDTWIVAIFLAAIGSMVPLLISYLLSDRYWRHEDRVYWLLPNPVGAAIEVGNVGSPYRAAFFWFAGGAALLMTLLNLPWFWRQMARFRPFAGTGTIPTVLPVVPAGEVTVDSNQTAP